MPRDVVKLRATRERWRKKKRDQGLCFICGKKAITTRCETCLFKAAAIRHLGSSKSWRRLKRKFRTQKGRCYYTNMEIALGSTASIEHVEPVSRFRSKSQSLNNIHWVHKNINYMKRDMTVYEFIKACKKVLENFGYAVSRHHR